MRPNKPAFHIFQPNPLIGNRTMVILNPAMANSLCNFIETSDISEEDAHIYALAKGVRRYYRRMDEMYQSHNETVESK